MSIPRFKRTVEDRRGWLFSLTALAVKLRQTPPSLGSSDSPALRPNLAKRVAEPRK